MVVLTAHAAVWSIAAVSVLGVITRPRNWPEAWWAFTGAAALVLSSLLPLSAALHAVLKGTDVYLFLIGMMVLAELARREGLFDWLARSALRHARGSARRLFVLIYFVGTLVTVFLSNDATAVVLTPAVYAAAKQARTAALPYLLICAMIANAASFVLPISNPANLVMYGDHVPPLWHWVMQFALASTTSIAVTFVLLYATQRRWLQAPIARDVMPAPLPHGGRLAAGALGATAVVLLLASTRGWPLGLPTVLCGMSTWLLISALNRAAPWPVLKAISWGVLPLVAGLFVLVEAVNRSGAFSGLSQIAGTMAGVSPRTTALAGGIGVAFLANLVNNLPMGLMAANLVQSVHLPAPVIGALLVGVDLGPNLSVTGSLATILWLTAIRREGENVSAWRFLSVGARVMPLALLAALAVLSISIRS